MPYKKILIFLLAAGLSLVAAGYRWKDSGHAIGLISHKGGKVRHPSILESGQNRYTQIITATVLPPYRGNARVALEGAPPMDYDIHFTEPVVDLDLQRKPRFENNIFTDLQAGDRIALWLIMRPSPAMTSGKYTLAFYDTASDKSLLRVPIIFKAKEDKNANTSAH